MIPNPAYRWGDDLNPNAPQKASLDDMLVKKHGKWQVGHERGADDKDTLWRKFKARDSKSARDLLDKLQDTLYVQNEQGCRIRRETQGMFYMCCDGAYFLSQMQAQRLQPLFDCSSALLVTNVTITYITSRFFAHTVHPYPIHRSIQD